MGSGEVIKVAYVAGSHAPCSQTPTNLQAIHIATPQLLYILVLKDTHANS